MVNFKNDFEIVVEDEWVRIRVNTGTVVTVDFIISILKELYSMEAYRTEKIAGLWDFRGCTSDIEYETMKKIKDYIDASYDPNWTHSLTAFVVDQDLTYGLSRMYEMISDDLPTTLRIFKDMKEAMEWIREEITQR